MSGSDPVETSNSRSVDALACEARRLAVFLERHGDACRQQAQDDTFAQQVDLLYQTVASGLGLLQAGIGAEPTEELDVALSAPTLGLSDVVEEAAGSDEAARDGDSRTAAEPPPEPLPPTPYPTLRCEVLPGGDELPQLMIPNSPVPVPVKTDVFSGQLLVLLRRPGEDLTHHPYPTCFEGRQRTMEVQCQGVFNTLPQEPLFVGAEITNAMQLGLLRRTLCNAILAFIRKLMSSVHFSFGHPDNCELPHIVVPLWTAVDRLVATPLGEEPPKLGEPVPESDADRSMRRAQGGKPKGLQGDKLLRHTLTFSFNTMYLDLPSWVVCKLPMMRSMPLTEFWNDAALRLVVYDSPAIRDRHNVVDPEDARVYEEPHLQTENRYAMRVQITRVEEPDADRLSVAEHPLGLLEDEEESEEEGALRETEELEHEQEEGEEGEFFDAVDYDSAEAALGPGLHQPPSELLEEFALPSSPPASPLPPHGPAAWPGVLGPCRCIGWLQGRASGKSTVYMLTGLRRTVLRTFKDCQPLLALADARVKQVKDATAVDIRLSAVFTKHARFSTKECQRRQLDEALRVLLLHGDATHHDRLQHFFARESSADAALLSKSGAQRKLTGKTFRLSKVAGLVHEDEVLLARSECHWAEYWLALRVHVIDWFCPTTRKRSLRLATKDVASVRLLDEDEAPFPPPIGLSGVSVSNATTSTKSSIRTNPAGRSPVAFLAIETLGRVHVMAVRKEAAHLWLERINFVRRRVARVTGVVNNGGADETVDAGAPEHGASVMAVKSATNTNLDASDSAILTAVSDVHHAFTLVGNERYGRDNRHVLNCRTPHFLGTPTTDPFPPTTANTTLKPGGAASGFGLSSSGSSGDGAGTGGGGGEATRVVGYRALCPVVEQLLSQAFAVKSNRELRPFLDGVCALRQLKLPPPGEGELDSEADSNAALAFFLNLYHLMVVHAGMIFGTPDSLVQVTKFVNRMCYELDGDILSIAEVEHGVLRAGMSAPVLMSAVASLVLPKISNPFHFRLRTGDARLNFAINCGSLSSPPFVPVYRVESLDSQLDRSTAEFLKRAVIVVQGKRAVTVPRIMQWYASDFGGGSTLEILNFVRRFLAAEPQQELSEMLNGIGFGASKVKLKYAEFATQCRALALQRPSSKISRSKSPPRGTSGRPK